MFSLNSTMKATAAMTLLAQRGSAKNILLGSDLDQCAIEDVTEGWFDHEQIVSLFGGNINPCPRADDEGVPLNLLSDKMRYINSRDDNILYFVKHTNEYGNANYFYSCQNRSQMNDTRDQFKKLFCAKYKIADDEEWLIDLIPADEFNKKTQRRKWFQFLAVQARPGARDFFSEYNKLHEFEQMEVAGPDCADDEDQDDNIILFFCTAGSEPRKLPVVKWLYPNISKSQMFFHPRTRPDDHGNRLKPLEEFANELRGDINDLFFIDDKIDFCINGDNQPIGRRNSYQVPRFENNPKKPTPRRDDTFSRVTKAFMKFLAWRRVCANDLKFEGVPFKLKVFSGGCMSSNKIYQGTYGGFCGGMEYRQRDSLDGCSASGNYALLHCDGDSIKIVSSGDEFQCVVRGKKKPFSCQFVLGDRKVKELDTHLKRQWTLLDSETLWQDHRGRRRRRVMEDLLSIVSS